MKRLLNRFTLYVALLLCLFAGYVALGALVNGHMMETSVLYVLAAVFVPLTIILFL